MDDYPATHQPLLLNNIACYSKIPVMRASHANMIGLQAGCSVWGIDLYVQGSLSRGGHKDVTFKRVKGNIIPPITCNTGGEKQFHVLCLASMLNAIVRFHLPEIYVIKDTEPHCKWFVDIWDVVDQDSSNYSIWISSYQLRAGSYGKTILSLIFAETDVFWNSKEIQPRESYLCTASLSHI